jgi:hypothetical protein
MDLAMVIAEISKSGSFSTNGTLDQVRRAAVVMGLAERRMKSDGSGNVMRPMESDKAPARSLSAVFGLGRQPLHTDGAHLPDPPDIIVLYAEKPTPTPTSVWFLADGGRKLPECVRHGVFTVRGNGRSFLATAYSGERFRVDPVCMSPADQHARQATEYFDAQRDLAKLHEWDSPHQLLFIDNRHALHGREAVVDDVKSRVIERLALRAETRK